ncbi:MAG TPA: Re/Si-specific NAD(P)(+) transhydrogenase subunit alpha [candidate division Zixibacteria bacterium]|jgi:NAD(P) transhydrogenase subunit alpha
MAETPQTLTIGIARELAAHENRVAVVPVSLAAFAKAGVGAIVEQGAGIAAGYPDADYRAAKAEIVSDRKAVFAGADIVCQLHGLGANPTGARVDLDLVRKGQVLVGFHEALAEPKSAQELAAKGVTILSMELMPRITRAQSMDAISSMATVAGYKAVLLAAGKLPRMFPMLMTAAGTVAPARVFVVGAGVAGLQAIATARRLGAVVSAYDVRSAVKEQVESLGAKFVEMELDAGDAEDRGGYAREMGEDFYRRQREMMLKAVTTADVVITTAAIPGKKAPVLITEEMVQATPAGSVIVDLAAESGGNCALTKPDETIHVHNTTIIGAMNLASTVPYHASQMYSRNIQTFLLHLLKDGRLNFDSGDEIVAGTLVARDGQIVHPKVKEKLGHSTAILSGGGA